MSALLSYSIIIQDELATPGPLPSDRKRSRSPGTSASQRQKIRRVSFDQGMSELVGAFCEMVDAMKSRLVSTPRPESSNSSTDDPLTRAITALEKDGGLSDDELAEAVHYFMIDRDIARVYAILETPRLRSRFLRRKLESLRKNL